MSKEREITVVSQGQKRIDVLFVVPEVINDETGFMLVLHGWGGNRYQYRDMMLDFSDRYNVICISPEYRDSGFDASPTGHGIRQPYDFSHLQVIDALTSFQTVRKLYENLDWGRSFVWGGSQGGHIALLASEFAPSTFALTIDACGIVYPTESFWNKAGWRGRGPEFEIRDARRFIDNIQNKVIIFHGGKDESVSIEQSYELEKLLKQKGKDVEAHYYPNGDHFLRPETTRMDATIQHASKDILSRRRTGVDDFSKMGQTLLECSGRRYVVDFSRGVPIIKMEETT
ncbi:alpha/beta fold hydrolase [Candidatus Bathyarchaeota archaeon]|nr:MAG: alpha/beta fold hydrolase [Candidatus Bathyarchaeota archaeon]